MPVVSSHTGWVWRCQTDCDPFLTCGTLDKLTDTHSLHAQLHGRFRVWDDAEQVRTPKSAKGQALLALLLTSERYERGRGWLQDKLWSDRAPPQGAASLRQALTDIRRAFGDQADILQAGRKAIALDPARIRVAQDKDGEFLEGLDVRDPEFNLWLAGQRAAQQIAQVPQGSDPLFTPQSVRRLPIRGAVLFLTETQAPGALQITETLFVDGVIRTLSEELEVEIFRKPPVVARPGTLLVSVQAFQVADRSIGLRVSLEEVDTGVILWAESNISPAQGAPNTGEIAMLALGNRLAARLRNALLGRPLAPGGDADANTLASLAIHKMFTMRKEDLIEAETLLLQAHEIQPRGVFQSWLAQLYSIQFVERVHAMDDLREKSEASCARALEMDPQNSNVLASVADASLVIGRNFARSAQLAKMSVAANPSNPRAWWTQASADLYCGSAEAAHRAAINAQQLANGTRLQFWTDIQRGLAAIVRGRTVEGLRMLEASSALAPDFHPPLRYLTALYAAAGMEDEAQECARRLRVLEPDFTFDRLANDPDYPVSLMRQHGMLDAVQLR